MNEREIKMQIEDKIPIIVSALAKGKDVEVRKCKDGITVAEVSKIVHR